MQKNKNKDERSLQAHSFSTAYKNGSAYNSCHLLHYRMLKRRKKEGES